MADNKPTTDVTKDWQASQGQKSGASRLRLFAVLATLIGVSYQPPSVEQYTQDMNQCAAQIKAGQPTTACSPAVSYTHLTLPTILRV